MADDHFSLKSIASSVAGNAMSQYNQFMTKEKFLKFNFKTNHLDSFLYQVLAINVDYSDLLKTM